MEDALAQHRKPFRAERPCLNPCCNGRCTRTKPQPKEEKLKPSLNPCCNGRCTRTKCNGAPVCWRAIVLILVVMEDALALSSSKLVTDYFAALS